MTRTTTNRPAWSASDRKYFRDRPERSLRVRKLVRGEMQPHGTLPRKAGTKARVERLEAEGWCAALEAGHRRAARASNSVAAMLVLRHEDGRIQRSPILVSRDAWKPDFDEQEILAHIAPLLAR